VALFNISFGECVNLPFLGKWGILNLSGFRNQQV